MPAQWVVLRIVLGVLCVGFAHVLGRSIAGKQTPVKSRTGPASWALRVLLTGIGVAWKGGVDLLASVVFALSVVAAALGFYYERRPKKPAEDLTKQMFPDE